MACNHGCKCLFSILRSWIIPVGWLDVCMHQDMHIEWQRKGYRNHFKDKIWTLGGLTSNKRQAENRAPTCQKQVSKKWTLQNIVNIGRGNGFMPDSHHQRNILLTITKVKASMSDYIPHDIMDVISYPCHNLCLWKGFSCHLGSLLLTWFNSNPSMHK